MTEPTGFMNKPEEPRPTHGTQGRKPEVGSTDDEAATGIRTSYNADKSINRTSAGETPLGRLWSVRR